MEKDIYKDPCMNDPKIDKYLKGKTIVKVLKSDDCSENEDKSYEADKIQIELSDGSFVEFWTSEWGGIKYYGTRK